MYGPIQGDSNRVGQKEYLFLGIGKRAPFVHVFELSHQAESHPEIHAIVSTTTLEVDTQHARVGFDGISVATDSYRSKIIG